VSESAFFHAAAEHCHCGPRAVRPAVRVWEKRTNGLERIAGPFALPGESGKTPGADSLPPISRTARGADSMAQKAACLPGQCAGAAAWMLSIQKLVLSNHLLKGKRAAQLPALQLVISNLGFIIAQHSPAVNPFFTILKKTAAGCPKGPPCRQSAFTDAKCRTRAALAKMRCPWRYQIWMVLVLFLPVILVRFSLAEVIGMDPLSAQMLGCGKVSQEFDGSQPCYSVKIKGTIWKIVGNYSILKTKKSRDTCLFAEGMDYDK